MAKSPAPRNARSTRKAARPRVWRGNHGSVVIAPATRRLTAVRQLASPPRIDRPRRIHPRRFPPRVPEGQEQIVRARLLPIARMAARAVSPGDELTITRSTELTGPGAKSTASNVGEPSVAVNGDVVLYTGNWYAAVSVDGGKTFRFLDPSTAFARFDPPGSSFCCDQVAQYIPSLDTFVWLLQSSTGDEIDNFQRLAFAKTSDVAKGRWRLFDITAANLGVAGTFLDFPDLALGAGALYMTTNVFPPRSQQVGTAVVRIPFTSIANGPFKIDRFVNFSHQSFRVAQNCGATAFFAAHESTSSLRVFSWKESQAMPISKTVGVARWIGGDGYRSKTPDRRRWLDRADSRITGATLAGSELWFAWGVDRDRAVARTRSCRWRASTAPPCAWSKTFSCSTTTPRRATRRWRPTRMATWGSPTFSAAARGSRRSWSACSPIRRGCWRPPRAGGDHFMRATAGSIGATTWPCGHSIRAAGCSPRRATS